MEPWSYGGQEESRNQDTRWKWNGHRLPCTTHVQVQRRERKAIQCCPSLRLCNFQGCPTPLGKGILRS